MKIIENLYLEIIYYYILWYIIIDQDFYQPTIGHLPRSSKPTVISTEHLRRSSEPALISEISVTLAIDQPSGFQSQAVKHSEA